MMFRGSWGHTPTLVMSIKDVTCDCDSIPYLNVVDVRQHATNSMQIEGDQIPEDFTYTHFNSGRFYLTFFYLFTFILTFFKIKHTCFVYLVSCFLGHLWSSSRWGSGLRGKFKRLRDDKTNLPFRSSRQNGSEMVNKFKLAQVSRIRQG